MQQSTLLVYVEVSLKLFLTGEKLPECRCFAWERAGEFVYLALERCARTLYDAVLHVAADDYADCDDELPMETLWQISRDAVEGVHVRLPPRPSLTLAHLLPCTLAQLYRVFLYTSTPRIVTSRMQNNHCLHTHCSAQFHTSEPLSYHSDP